MRSFWRLFIDFFKRIVIFSRSGFERESLDILDVVLFLGIFFRFEFREDIRLVCKELDGLWFIEIN